MINPDVAELDGTIDNLCKKFRELQACYAVFRLLFTQYIDHPLSLEGVNLVVVYTYNSI